MGLGFAVLVWGLVGLFSVISGPSRVLPFLLVASVSWTAEAECGDCGWRGEAGFEDGAVVESGHECDEDG